jgi:outer membrane lipase/esterase
MFSRCVVASAALVLSLNLVTAPASAQVSNYGRIVAFGDSLSDNGNLTTFGFAPPPPYDSGRFSNGPTWVEILAGTPPVTGAASTMTQFWTTHGVTGNVDVALGGARADNSVAVPPGVPSQISAFSAFGGTFGPKDLVTVWAGANDIFQFFTANPAPTQAQVTTQGITTAGNEAANVQSLIGMGAKTILVANLPNLGATPSFNGTPTSSAGGFVASSAYNGALDAHLKGIAAAVPGVNIVQMDTFSAFNAIIKNPAAFGFTNVTAACTATAACVTGTPAAQNKYLFWDSVHPTEAGHILLAQYANLLLSTGQIAPVITPLAEVGLYSRLDASDAAFNRALDMHDGYEHKGIYAQVVGNRASVDANGTAPKYNYDLAGARAGFDNRSGGFSYGAAVAYQTGNLFQPTLKSDLGAAQADLYAMAHLGSWFLSAQGGYSYTQFHNMHRQTGFGPVRATANADSDQWSTAVGAGTTLHLGSLNLTPGARVGYITSSIGGITEAADVLALHYSSREIETGFWDARLRASTSLSGGVKAFVEAGYQDFFNTSSGDITAQLVNNTAHPVTVTASDPMGRGAFLKLGADAKLASGMTISAEYGLSLQNGGGENHAGTVQVKIPLSGGSE